MRIFFLLAIIFYINAAFAQKYSGRIVHSETGMAVPFANIRYQENQGVITDIDGHYAFEAQGVDSLRVSYVGFSTKTAKALPGRQQVIELTPAAINLDEVVITPRRNPALRVVNKLINNREANNPDKYNTYSYRAYDKLVFTIHEDSLAARREKLAEDSSFMKIKAFFDKQYLFLMENITKVNYQRPDKKQEEILASRTSGFNVPVFTVLLSQMQSASFYNKRIEIAGEVYYNPFTTGSLPRYWFIMEDTLLTARGDTSYVIAFRPRRKGNLEGLQGVATISSSGWAFENIMAEPAVSDRGGIHVRIEQNYERVEGQYWFPSQQNTELFLSNVQAGGVPLLGRGRRYLFEVTVNDTEEASFNPAIARKYANDAFDRESNTFRKYRRVPFTEKDMETYRVIDSLGRARNFSAKMKTLQSILKGDLRMGKFKVPLGRLIDKNKHEGWRLGAGLATNREFSEHLSLEAYGAYGFKDNRWKYGGKAGVYFDKLWRNGVVYKFSDDLAEVGQYNSRTVLSITNTETFRNFGITALNHTLRHYIELTAKPWSSLQVRPFLQQERMKPVYEFPRFPGVNTFRFLEAGVSLRFAFREKFMVLPRKEVSMGTPWPVLQVRFQKGMEYRELGSFDYGRLFLKLNHGFNINRAGKTSYRVEAGMVSEDVPLMKTFHGKGSSGAFFFSPYSFTTMKYGEFYQHRFVSLFLEHNFDELLLNTRYFSPAVSVHHHMQFGKYANLENQTGTAPMDTRNGYYESGLVLGEIFDLGVAAIGVSAFYRYGYYALPSPGDNLSLLVSLKFFGN